MEGRIPITNPYPVPEVCTVSIEKPPGRQTVGIGVRNANENTVVVSRLPPDSLLRSTTIAVGHEILAVNGIAAHKSVQVTDIIKSNNKLEFTTFDPSSQSRQSSPFCYVEVAPTSKINPGVSFDSCCGRTMVMVSHVFVSDLTRTRLRVGDIVLAVNGVPVWKPEDADKEQLAAARASKAVLLYCINMKELRDYFTARTMEMHVEQLQRQHQQKVGQHRMARIEKKDNNSYWIKERDCLCVAQVNYSTQLFDDKTDWEHRIKTSGGDHTSKHLFKKDSYKSYCVPMLNDLNDLMHEQLRVLKLRIVGRAWDYSRHDSETVVYAVPSAPSVPMDIPASLPMAEAVPLDVNEFSL